MKRTVLVVIGGFPAISQTFVLREIAAMMEQGWRVHVLSSAEGPPLAWEQAREFGITNSIVTYLNWRTTWPSATYLTNLAWKYVASADFQSYGRVLGLRRLGFFLKAARVCRQFDVQLVHAHFVQWASEVGVGLSSAIGVPLTVTAHDGHLASYSDAVLGRVQSSAAAVACVSNGWRDLWQSKTGSADKLAYIPNGIALDEFTVPVRVCRRAPRVLSVSTCSDLKRPYDLVEAVAILRGRGIDVECEIIGDGECMGRLRGLIALKGLEQYVTLRGAQPHSVVREAMAQADVFALCSERESFGIVTAEAMASGLPTVVSDTSGSRDIVSHGCSGFIYPVGKVDSLAEHLADFILDCDKRVRFGLAGRCRVEQLFSWERHMQMMNRMWEACLADTDRRANC